MSEERFEFVEDTSPDVEYDYKIHIYLVEDTIIHSKINEFLKSPFDNFTIGTFKWEQFEDYEWDIELNGTDIRLSVKGCTLEQWVTIIEHLYKGEITFINE